jgi:molybdopterin-guanine dinucleotide biosynthesis protein
MSNGSYKGINFRLEIHSLFVYLFIYFILSAYLVCSCMGVEGFKRGNKKKIMTLKDKDPNMKDKKNMKDKSEDIRDRVKKYLSYSFPFKRKYATAAAAAAAAATAAAGAAAAAAGAAAAAAAAAATAACA